MFNNKIEELLAIKKGGIWVRTSDEKEVLVAIKNILDATDEFENVYTWSMTAGIELIKTVNGNLTYENKTGPGVDKLFAQLRDEVTNTSIDNNAYILKDYHLVLNNPNAVRAIRDMKEKRSEKYIPLIVISPVCDIPVEFEKLFAIVEYENPTQDEIKNLLGVYESKSNVVLPNKSQLSKLFVGFSRQEIIETIMLSVNKYGEVNVSEISEKKIQIIKDTGVLDYKRPVVTLDDIGGNYKLKSWLEESMQCMSPEAKEYGVPSPKGYLALGIPGTSKSIMAEAFAGQLNQPFLKLDMSKIVSKFAGESERNASKALELIKSCAPCVLLIDEVEKKLGGYASSNKSDSGAIARVFGQILEFMQDNESGVYVIMTSNDVSQLPPELTRAGRLDAIWYFSLPDSDEREEIFKVHFNKIKKSVDLTTLRNIVKNTNEYTGAEIEQIVKYAIRKAFIRKTATNTDKGITVDDLNSAKNLVVPIAKSSKEKIKALELWAKGRALYANERESKIKIENMDDII
jgi:SpoVK/Ycf46/Vps4 family AAA+-type ATPase